MLCVGVEQSSVSSFHKWRLEVNFEQVPSGLDIEMYLHLISYNIKGYVPGKPALGKKKKNVSSILQ